MLCHHEKNPVGEQLLHGLVPKKARTKPLQEMKAIGNNYPFHTFPFLI